MDRCKVLVIGAQPAQCDALVGFLRQRNVLALVTDQPDQAIRAAEDTELALTVLAGSHAFCARCFDALAERRHRQTIAPLLVIATDSSEAFAVAALRAGAQEYLAEPLGREAFLRTLSRWLPESDIPPGVELTGGEVFIGRSPAMQALRTQIRRVAATDCNVLITGETGTGKELVAQLIHQNSPRNKNPLISINCAAIPDSLLESELFGYERGAFTGAARANEGKLMAANRGTVFFDEVGDMSPVAQAKVLRAIETKEVQRLGSTKACGTDIRIVAATHRNLENAANPEAFRRDLYFRLNVGRIFLPPLRDRKADVACLVDRMVIDMNRKFGRRIEGVSGSAMRNLEAHDWPGNVRELKNVIERAFIVRESGLIGTDDLSVSTRLPLAQPKEMPDDDLRSIQEALSNCNGNKSKAAERLNCSRMTLYRKLAKYQSLEAESRA